LNFEAIRHPLFSRGSFSDSVAWERRGDSLGGHVSCTEGQSVRCTTARLDGLRFCREPGVFRLLHVDFTPVQRPRRVIDTPTLSSEVPLDGLSFGGFAKCIFPRVASVVPWRLCA